VATEAFSRHLVPITVGILVLLFFFQKRGTAGVGSVFGPVMALWFSTLALLHFGFMEDPNVPEALRTEHQSESGRDFEKLEDPIYFVGGQILIPSEEHPGMALWRGNSSLSWRAMPHSRHLSTDCLRPG
jgi:K+ transporter